LEHNWWIKEELWSDSSWEDFRDNTLISCKVKDLNLKLVQIHLGAQLLWEYRQTQRNVTKYSEISWI
jgi:hypothetical protein